QQRRLWLGLRFGLRRDLERVLRGHVDRRGPLLGRLRRVRAAAPADRDGGRRAVPQHVGRLGRRHLHLVLVGGRGGRGAVRRLVGLGRLRRGGVRLGRLVLVAHA